MLHNLGALVLVAALMSITVASLSSDISCSCTSHPRSIFESSNTWDLAYQSAHNVLRSKGQAHLAWEGQLATGYVFCAPMS